MPDAKLQFTNTEVAASYEMLGDHVNDFQIRVPAKKWYGQFSEITPEIAEQLIAEKYNHIKKKDAKK